jgi:membrane fusion protein, heavy metal efflux system
MPKLPITLTLVLLVTACSKTAPGENPSQKPAPAKVEHPRTEAELTTVTLSADAIRRIGVQTVAASTQPVPRSRTLGGEVMVPEGKAVVVSAPVAGTLVGAGAGTAGSRVRKGQPVFRLMPLAAGERDQRIEAQRAVDSAGAEEQAVKKRLDRLEQLLKDGAASVRAVEEARAQYEVAAAALTAARARLESLSNNPIGPQGELTITAPLDGVLQSVTAAQGQTVAASSKLFEIAQIDTLWVRVPVYAGEIGDVDMTQPASLTTLDGSGAPRTLRRVTAPLTADPGAASVDVVYEIVGSPGSLRPGQRVSVQMPIVSSDKGLVVPDAAVLYDMHGTTWVYEDQGGGKYLRRRVEVARQTAGRALISRGLAEGTRVVTTGAAEIFGTEFATGK